MGPPYLPMILVIFWIFLDMCAVKQYVIYACTSLDEIYLDDEEYARSPEEDIEQKFLVEEQRRLEAQQFHERNQQLLQQEKQMQQ